MVAVLSHGLWQRAFGADPAIIGKTITLSGSGYTVVGVMPPDFKIFNPPAVFGLPTGAARPQLWIPYAGSMNEAGAHFFLGFGRLKPEIAPSRAQASLNAVSARLATEFPALKDWGASVRPLQEQIVGGARPALILLLVAVGLVLLIACANVANLSLARSTARRSEFALRAALGASRSRLILQSLVESAMLALSGGALGVFLARGGLAALVALQSSNLPRLEEIQLNTTVLFFSFLISLLTSLIFGLAPALRASNPDLNASLRESGLGCGKAPSRRRAGDLLMVAEVALAMILLTGAGLMIHSFARFGAVPPGFQPEQLLTFDFSPAVAPYSEDATQARLHREILDRIRPLPGVQSAATVYGLPFGSMLNATCGVALDDPSRPDNQPAKAYSAWRVVTPGYFETIRVPMVEGRPFSEKLDSATSPPAAIVNEAFARKRFPGQSPLGRRIRVYSVGTNWLQTIVGVVRDVKLTGLDAPAAPEVYQPASQQPPWMFSLVVRSSLPPRQLETLVRSQLDAVDRDLAPFNSRTMENAICSSVGGPRVTTTLIGLFAVLALALTVVGIYGVMSYSVSRRTREIGVRIALGATRGSVIRLVLRRGLILTLVGAALGLCGSFALTRLLASQLFGVSPRDPGTFATVAAILMLVGLSACYPPSRRAARMDAVTALRAE